MKTETAYHSRAKAGGEYGANGEWYKGGAFINTVPENPKGEAKKVSKTGKQQYENYKWMVSPIEGQRALFEMLAGFEMPIRSKENWKDIVAFEFNSALRGEFATPEFIEIRKARIAAYNGGQRWI